MTSKKVNVCLVGPVYPYRGGISKYNENLIDALDKMSSLNVVSFKHLYPKFLYPGSNIKDSSKTRNHNYSYIINAYWPPSLDEAARKIVDDKTDIAIITWWTLFWQPGMTYLARKLRKKGIKVIFLCHNLYDHDSKKLLQQLSRLLLRQADGYIVHDTEGLASLRADFPGKEVLMRNHPVYTLDTSSKKQIKKRGKIELLFFGMIRPYKGLDILLDSLATLNDGEVYATIAGEYWGDSQTLLDDIKNRNIPNIETHLEYVSEEKASVLFDRADVVVMPYLSATGSGVATLAFSRGKPIIASRVGCFKDIIDEAKTGWLITPGSSKELAETIGNLTRSDIQKTRKYIEKFCRDNDWEGMAKEIIKFAGGLNVR